MQILKYPPARVLTYGKKLVVGNCSIETRFQSYEPGKGENTTYGMRTIAPNASADRFLNVLVIKRFSSALSSWACLGKRGETCLHDSDPCSVESSCMSILGELKGV